MGEKLTEALAVISVEHCKGCGLCVIACPKDVLVLQKGFNSAGYHPAAYTGSGCNGCGYCFYACPEPAAVTVYKKGAEPAEDVAIPAAAGAEKD